MDIELNRDSHLSSALTTSPKSNRKKRTLTQHNSSDARNGSSRASSRHRRSLSTGESRPQNTTRQRSRTASNTSEASPRSKHTSVHFDPSIDQNDRKGKRKSPAAGPLLHHSLSARSSKALSSSHRDNSSESASEEIRHNRSTSTTAVSV